MEILFCTEAASSFTWSKQQTYAFFYLYCKFINNKLVLFFDLISLAFETVLSFLGELRLPVSFCTFECRIDLSGFVWVRRWTVEVAVIDVEPIIRVTESNFVRKTSELILFPHKVSEV